jgi:branched-chain amino acid transport system substrate-binding protein
MTKRHAMVAGWATAVLLAAGGLALAAGQYGPGASDSEIKIGNTMPYSGPASAYGTIGKAEAAFFNSINEQGGVNGRKIKLISLDDGYSPPRTVEQHRKMVEEDNVLAIVGTMGTPTNSAIIKYMNAKQVPQIFIATGASKWGANPTEFPWTMGWYPTYRNEGVIYGKYIVGNIKDAKIAVLYQNDDYGKDFVNGFKHGLGADAGKLIVKEVTYEVSDPTVDSQIVTLKDSGANVFFSATTNKVAAQAIRKAYDIGWRPLLIAGVTGSQIAAALTPAGLQKSIGLVTVQGKDPSDPEWADDPDLKAYRAFMQKYLPAADPNDVLHYFGYSNGFMIADTLRRCGDDLTREHLVDVLIHTRGLHAPIMLPGVTLNMSPTDYDGFKQFQLFRFDGAHYVPFGDLIDVSAMN